MRIPISKKNVIRRKTWAGSAYKLKAFSLIELSVAIVIISIVVSGLLSLVTNSVNNDKAKKTQDNIARIYQAMGVYLLVNGAHLPCPAPIISKKLSDGEYGKDNGNSGVCAMQEGVYDFQDFVYGMVPVRNLGLPSDVAEDGYGSKFGYLIYKEFTGDNFGITNSDGVGIDIMKKNTSLVNASEMPIFAIISYGPNKAGAFNANSNSQNPLSSDAAEQNNYPTNFTDLAVNTAVFHNDGGSYPTKVILRASSSDNTTVFDDVIFYKTRNEMVRDFNAMNLIKCPALTADAINYNGSTPTDWPQGEYNSVVLSVTDCPTGWKATVSRPGRRCNAYGQWEESVSPYGDIAIPCTQ